jgi:uncharacterized membrane protein (DUF485 family)
MAMGPTGHAPQGGHGHGGDGRGPGRHGLDAPGVKKLQLTAGEVIASPEFKALVRQRWTVSLTLLGVLFLIYYGYILLIPYAPGLMKARIGHVTTLAIPLGLGVIAAAFLLTALYVGWANQRYDPEVERLKGQLRR